jgi:GNAT superfamily N-acetyltransferase
MVSPEQAYWEEHFCLPVYRGGWTDINTAYRESHQFYASCCPRGEAEELGGIFATCCGTEWAGLNFAFLTEPVRSASRFEPRLARAKEFYRMRKLPWILVISDTWVAPEQRDAVYQGCQASGFQLAMDAKVFQAEGMEALPASELVLEPVADRASWQDFARINAEAWNVPVEPLTPLFASEKFQQEVRGYMGYVGGVPVSVASEFHTAQYNFLSWVATLPEYRKLGYGERAIRHTAAHSEKGRPILGISSPQGLPTWLRCGFREGERFRLYLAPSA